VKKNIITEKEAFEKAYADLHGFSINYFARDLKKTMERNKAKITNGIGATPGVVSGRVAFSEEQIIRVKSDDPRVPVIYVAEETDIEDIGTFAVSDGVITLKGGPHSHAAINTASMRKPCVVGAEEFIIKTDTENGTKTLVFIKDGVEKSILREGEFLTFDGETGDIYLGDFRNEIKSTRLDENRYREIGVNRKFSDIVALADEITQEEEGDDEGEAEDGSKYEKRDPNKFLGGIDNTHKKARAVAAQFEQVLQEHVALVESKQVDACEGKFAITETGFAFSFDPAARHDKLPVAGGTNQENCSVGFINIYWEPTEKRVRKKIILRGGGLQNRVDVVKLMKENFETNDYIGPILDGASIWVKRRYIDGLEYKPMDRRAPERYEIEAAEKKVLQRDPGGFLGGVLASDRIARQRNSRMRDEFDVVRDDIEDGKSITAKFVMTSKGVSFSFDLNKQHNQIKIPGKKVEEPRVDGYIFYNYHGSSEHRIVFCYSLGKTDVPQDEAVATFLDRLQMNDYIGYYLDGANLYIDDEFTGETFKYDNLENYVRPKPGVVETRAVAIDLRGLRTDEIVSGQHDASTEATDGEEKARQKKDIHQTAEHCKGVLERSRPGVHPSVVIVPVDADELQYGRSQLMAIKGMVGRILKRKYGANTRVVYYIRNNEESLEEAIGRAVSFDNFETDLKSRLLVYVNENTGQSTAKVDKFVKAILDRKRLSDRLTGVVPGAFETGTIIERFSVVSLLVFGLGLMDMDRYPEMAGSIGEAMLPLLKHMVMDPEMIDDAMSRHRNDFSKVVEMLYNCEILLQIKKVDYEELRDDMEKAAQVLESL